MHALITQIQLALSALGALLPLVPAGRREQAARILEALARALAALDVAAVNHADLAAKLRTLRAEIETMAEADAVAGVEAIEAAFQRVLTASAAFRAAAQA